MSNQHSNLVTKMQRWELNFYSQCWCCIVVWNMTSWWTFFDLKLQVMLRALHTYYIFCALGCYCFFKAMTKCIVPWHGTLLCGSRLPCNVWPSSVWALTINSCSCLLMHDAGLKSRHVKRNFLWASDNRVAKRSWLADWLLPPQIPTKHNQNLNTIWET